MSMLKDYRASLEELTARTPKKKAALIRSLLPSIEAALRSGQTLKDIWDTLDKEGLNYRESGLKANFRAVTADAPLTTCEKLVLFVLLLTLSRKDVCSP